MAKVETQKIETQKIETQKIRGELSALLVKADALMDALETDPALAERVSYIRRSLSFNGLRDEISGKTKAKKSKAPAVIAW